VVGRSISRRAALAALALLISNALGSSAGADEVTVPAELQVQLLGRVVRYEHGFAAHGTDPVHVLLVERPHHAESQRVAAQLAAALGHSADLGGRPVTVVRLEYTSASALRAETQRASATIVYLAGGLASEIGGIATSLSGMGVITVSAVGADVDQGAVLGFELASSRPQIAVNLPRATEQQLHFSAQFLRLARVVR
jgi:hypothetical protein